MKQYVILTDASDNSTYGIVVKDGMTFSVHGAHRKAEEWAGWANSQEQKSLEQLLPPGITQSTASTLHNDSHLFIKGLLDVAISGASFVPGKRSYIESHRTNAWSATPSARDFQLSAFSVDGRQQAVAFKALAFKSDSNSYSFAALLRSGAVGFNPQTGLVRSRVEGASSRHLQAKVDASIPRSIQRHVGMDDIAHKSLIKNRDIVGGQIEVKKLGSRLGSRLGGGLRAAPAGFVFIDVTGRIDADKDGIVFESTPMVRPIIPRFTVPESLGREISSLLQGSSEENEKLRRAGRLGDADVSGVRSQIEQLLGADASQLSKLQSTRTSATSQPLSPERARGVIQRARQIGASRVGRGEKTQINTEGSRAVEKISWDDKAKELIVTFNGGRTYTYKDVDDKWVKELESNPDFLGRILNDIKKQGFQYERGGKHAPDKTLSSPAQRRRESVGLRSSSKGPDATTNLNRIYDRILDRTGYDTESGSDKGPREVANIVHNRWKKATREERQDYIASEGNATDGAMALASDEGLLDDFDFSNPVDSMTPNQRLGMSSRSARRLSDKERGIQARAKITQLQEGDVLPENWDDDTKELGNPAGFSIEEIRKDSYPGFYTITLKNSRDGTIQKRQFEEDDTFPNVGRPSTLERGAPGEGRGRSDAVRTLAMLPGEPPRDAQRDRPVFGTRSRRSYDDESGSRGIREGVAESEHFEGSMWIDQLKGDNVDADVIPLADIYGDDRPGYAVVGVYRTDDGFGGIEYFYGGDDEEFDSVEDAMDFLQNIEDQGNEGILYGDPEFRSLDRVRSAGKPGRRPLEGLRSSSARRLTGTTWDDKTPKDGTPTDDDPFQFDFSADDLSEIDLSGANLSNAELGGKNLTGAKLNDINGSKIDLTDADLTRANMDRSDMIGAEMAGANLEQASLIQTDLTNANLEGANLEGADLLEARLENAYLREANLENAKLNAFLTDATLQGANLYGADMRDADLRGADLRDADLRNADLTGADLTGAVLTGADLDGAKLDQGWEQRVSTRSSRGIVGPPDSWYEPDEDELEPLEELIGEEWNRMDSDRYYESARDWTRENVDKYKMMTDDEWDSTMDDVNASDDPIAAMRELFKEYNDSDAFSDDIRSAAESDFNSYYEEERGRGWPSTRSRTVRKPDAGGYPESRTVRDRATGRVLRGARDTRKRGPIVDKKKRPRTETLSGGTRFGGTRRGRYGADGDIREGLSTRSTVSSDNWDNWTNSIAPTITNNPEIRDLLSTRDMGVGNYIRVGNDIVTPRDLKDILGVPSTRSASPYSGPSVSGVSLPTWDDLNKMRRIPGPTGLNEGYWFEDDSTGRIFFAKRGRSDGHAEAEVAGAAVYRVAGAGVPHKAIIKNEAGETWVVSEKIDNLQNTSNPTGRIRAQAKQDMGIDMLLQVRDAWSGGSNKMVDPIGVIHTVDTGGAGPYRAQGGAKTPEFSPDAEWTDVATMIYMPGAPIRGQHISNLYGRVSNNDLVVAMRRVEHLNLQKIDQEMIDADVPPAMRKLFVDTIAARQKMAKAMADEFEGYESGARVNVAGTDITPGGEKVASKAPQGLMSSIFRFRATDDGFKKDLFGPSTRSVVMTPVSRRDTTKPRYSDTLDGEVVMRGKDSAGGFQAEIVLTPDGDYVIVGRERNARGQWETVGFGAGKQDDVLGGPDNIAGWFSSIDEAEARIRDYVDGPDDMSYDDVVEYFRETDSVKSQLGLLATRSIADRNSGIKSARSASLAQRDGELRLARPADGFHYADFERMSDKQLLEEYFGALATRWESLSSSSGPSNNTEFQHIVSALRDRNMFGSVKELLNKYDMEYQSAVRRGVPFRIPDSEFGNDGSYGMPGKRPSLASLRSSRSDNEEDSNVEISMTLLQLGDLSKDLHDIDDAIGVIDDEVMSADAELGMPALYDALENAIGGVDSIVITREEFDAAKGTITGLQAMLQNGTLSKRYAASLGRLSNLIDQVDNSDGHFVTAQLAERGHMFDMPRPGQSDFIRKFGEIVSRAKAKGLLRGRNRSSYLNMEKEDRIPTIGRFRMPEPAVIDGYKESDDYEDNFQRWARLTNITSAYAKEQGLGEGVAPSRSAYEGSPQFYNDVRSWDAIQVARMNSWQGFDGDDDGRGNLSLRSTRANLASTRSKRVKREGDLGESNRIPWLRRDTALDDGAVVEGFLYSEESNDYFETWLNMVNNFEGFAEEQGIDLSIGEPDFKDYASSPQFAIDVQDWDYKSVRGIRKSSDYKPIDSSTGLPREVPVSSFDEDDIPLMSNRSARRSYESSDAFERGYNRFAMDANDIGFANEQEISLRRMPNRNDYRYSKAFNEDAAMHANGIEPGIGSGRGGRTSTRSGQFVNFTRPGSGNTTPRYSDTSRGKVVSRGRSSDGNARFEVIRDRDGSYSVSGQEKDERGKWVDVFSLDSDDEAQSGGLDNVFDSIEDAQEAINYYLTGPNSYDDFMGSIADQKPLLTRSTRSVSERKRIASIERGSSLRSSASTAIDGLKVPGARRIDEQDGRLWESLSPEQRGLVEARAIEIEENLIRGLSGPGNLRIDVNENGDIVSIEIDEPRKTTTINSIDAGSRVNEYIGLYGDVPDFNFWGSSSQKEVTGKNKRQQAKFDALEKYQLLSTERDPITGKWRVVLSPQGLQRLEETHGKVRELLLQKRDEIDADSKLSDGMKATKLKDINEKIKALDDQASALIVLASARVNAKDGRNEEGGNRFAFAPEQLPSSMRKELLSTPKTFGGAAAAKNKLFKKWAATQTGKSNKKLRANSKEYKDLKAKFDAGELPEVFAWYHKQDKDSSKSLAQLGLPEPEEFGWKRSAGNIDGIVGPNGKATPNYDDIIGDDPIVGDDVNLDFDHSSRLWSQDVLGIPDEDAAKVRGESFWRKLNLAKSVIPSPSEWINRHNERLQKRQELKNRLKRLKAGQAYSAGRAEGSEKTRKELKILKQIKAKRLQALQAKKRAAEEIYGTHTSKKQSTPTMTIDENGNPIPNAATLARVGEIELLSKPPKKGDLSKDDKRDAKAREKLEREIKAENLEADRILAAIWGINGYNERPTIVTEEEFVELAQDSGNTVIRRGHGGKTFAEWHLDNPGRHTTGDGGTLQGPGEYWSVRKDGGEMQPDSSWRGYVTTDAQKGTKGTEPGPGGTVAILPANAKIIRMNDLEKIKRDMNSVSGGIATALKDPSLPKDWRNARTGAAAEQLVELIQDNLYRSVPEGDPRWGTTGGKVISELVSAVRNASNPEERAKALDALRYFVQGTNGLLQNYLAPLLGYDAIRANNNVMLVMNRGALIEYGGVGGLSMTDELEQAIKNNSRMDPALVKKINRGERVD